MKGLWLPLFAAAPFLAIGTGEDSRTQLVNQIHRHMQSKFDDLEDVKNGRFGVSRLEYDHIEGHGLKGGAPGYNSDDFQNTIWIFGNKGKPLDPKTVSLRYTRLPSAINLDFKVAPDMNPERSKELPIETARLAILATKTERDPKTSLKNGTVRFDSRIIRLSKKECLPCHDGMKLGDPVAVLVVATRPLQKK